MQIVIDTMQCPCRTLSDECCISHNECYEDDICSSCPLIRNGGVKLQKGHGDLIDRDNIIGDIHGVRSITTVLSATIIIPADKDGD